MTEERSPLDFDDESDRGAGASPPRRMAGDAPPPRPGHRFGEDDADAAEAAAAAFTRSDEKWAAGSRAPDRGDHDAFHPAPTKLEITTPLEWLLGGASFALFAFAFVLFVERLSRASSVTPFDPRLPGGLAAAGALFLFLWMRTDNYYLTDPSRRRILYHFECLGTTFERSHLEGRQVEIVAVDCVKRSHKRKHRPRVYWNEYTVYAWYRDGGWCALTDPIREDRLQANQLAREAAAALGCAFGPGERDVIYRRGASGRVEPVDLSGDWLGLGRFPPWFLGVAAGALFALLLAGMLARHR